MRAEDCYAVYRLLLRNPLQVPFVTVFSPSNEELELVEKFWPGVSTNRMSESQWDLREHGPLASGGMGLAMACNTFMCAADPDLWLKNIARSHRYLVIQDLAHTQRQPHRHLSPETGDVARYSVSQYGIIGITDDGYTVYDLSLKSYVVDCISYTFDNGAGTKFAALIDLHGQSK